MTGTHAHLHGFRRAWALWRDEVRRRDAVRKAESEVKRLAREARDRAEYLELEEELAAMQRRMADWSIIRHAQGPASGLSATEAYERAGYQKDSGAASRLSGNVSVSARVTELQRCCVPLALFRKDDERALKATRPTDTAQAEKTARLRALRLAKEDADQAQAQDRR